MHPACKENEPQVLLKKNVGANTTWDEAGCHLPDCDKDSYCSHALGPCKSKKKALSLPNLPGQQ